MNNKKLGIIMGIIGTIGISIGAWSLYNSKYTTKIGGGDVPATIFLSIRPDNQYKFYAPLLLIILLLIIVLGIIILLKKRK